MPSFGGLEPQTSHHLYPLPSFTYCYTAGHVKAVGAAKATMAADKEARELLSDSDTSLQKTPRDTADGALVEHVPTALGDRNALPNLHRRLLWKIDLQLMPLAFIIYWLAFLDRTNIGVARLSGLQESLRMTGEDFMTAVALLYPLFM